MGSLQDEAPETHTGPDARVSPGINLQNYTSPTSLVFVTSARTCHPVVSVVAAVAYYDRVSLCHLTSTFRGGP